MINFESMNAEETNDPCEYNPRENRAANTGEFHAQAEWVVGTSGEWRLCDSCSKLKRFSRYRKRIKIGARSL